MKIIRGITLLAVLAMLTSCSDGEKPAQAVASSAPPSTKSSVESEDCRVAANVWANRIQGHILDAMTVAAVDGVIDIDDTEDPTSTIEVVCGPVLTDIVHNANAILATAAYQGSLCAFRGECDAKRAARIRRLAHRAGPLLARVQSMIG